MSSVARTIALGAFAIATAWAAEPARAQSSEQPPALLLARAVAHYQQGELMRAVFLLKRVQRAQPTNLDAGHYLGLALIRLGEVKQGRRVLKKIARAHPRALRVQLDLGLAYLEEGNAAWAARTLAKARRMAGESAQDALLSQIRYYEGVAQLQLKDGRAAARALAEATPPPGVAADELRLRRAIAHQLAGEYQHACTLAAGVEGGLRPMGQRLLRSAYAAQGINASLLSWQVMAEFFGDSNPLYEHETSVGGSPAIAVGLGATYRPWIGARSRLGISAAARGIGYLSYASDGNDANQASGYQLAADAFFAHRLAGTARPLELSVGYSFGLVGLHGDPPLADENHIFVERHVGQLAIAFALGRDNLQLSYRLGRVAFARRVRSHISQELFLGWSRTTFSNRLQLVGWLLGRSELADSQHYEALVPGAGLGLAYLAPLRLLFGARFGYELRHFYASASAYDGTRRDDHVLDLTLELGRTFAERFTPRVVYRFLRNVSSVTTFDYQRHMVAAQLIWRVD